MLPRKHVDRDLTSCLFKTTKSTPAGSMFTTSAFTAGTNVMRLVLKWSDSGVAAEGLIEKCASLGCFIYYQANSFVRSWIREISGSSKFTLHTQA